jgi:hypothetical protein
MNFSVEANLEIYLGDREPTSRYASFDYCYNHFHELRGERFASIEDPTGMELSCLHLGFYLASWGMLRGSSALLRRSVKHYEDVVRAIAAAEQTAWEIDADDYSDDVIDVVFRTAGQIRSALPDGASNILVTKIMLGVFGCVPAFDTYFKKGLGVATFGKRSLKRVAQFYGENVDAIERHRVGTLDFATGNETSLKYTRAKVIDMVFFVEGARG